jgi:diacylglycerol kinase (ATP)
MKPLAIVNPASGGGRCGRDAPRVLEQWARQGFDFDQATTTGPGDARDIATRAFGAGRRAFVSVGGDGTLFEIVNGIVGAQGDLREIATICVAPLGTGNSLARDLPVAPAGPDALARAVAMDLLRVNCRERDFYCANMISYGFAAAVGRLVNNRLKPLGPLGYSVGVLWMVAWLAPHLLPYGLGGGPMRREKLTLLSVANSRYTGAGMLMAPDARIDDGLIDIVSGAAIGRIELLRLFPKIFDGSHVGHRAVRLERSTSLEFDFAGPVGMIADGEFLEATPIRIDVAPQALRMVALEIATG